MQLLTRFSLMAVMATLAGQYVQAYPLDGAGEATTEVATINADQGTTGVTPAPRRLVRRLGNNSGQSMSNAMDVRVPCTGQTDNCDQNAYAILCRGAPRVLQKRSDLGHHNYQESGAGHTPFKGDRSKLRQEGVNRPPTPPSGEAYDSAEEYPWQGTLQGGNTAFVFPVQPSSQHSQGSRIRTMYSQYGIENGMWFHITAFDNCGGPYCIAFNNNDRTACSEPAVKAPIDWAKWIWKRASPKGAKYWFDFMGTKGGFSLG
ncbi:MAG: hypothetical protein M1823_004427 [Watsoniomyces obsoletus]|nr:MAG: hypothetical protein M1823_004427 [Watsoniomyces obsoletus]